MWYVLFGWITAKPYEMIAVLQDLYSVYNNCANLHYCGCGAEKSKADYIRFFMCSFFNLHSSYFMLYRTIKNYLLS